jgi:hypothetical protein
MKLWLAVPAAVLCGCTVTIEPGMREAYSTKADWNGAAATVVAAAEEGPEPDSRPGAVNYGFERAKWNPFLAETLSEDLGTMGATKGGPEVKIGLAAVRLEDRALNQAFFAEMTLRVTVGDFTRDYKGSHESLQNFPDASRKAAMEAMKAVVEDAELKGRCRP